MVKIRHYVPHGTSAFVNTLALLVSAESASKLNTLRTDRRPLAAVRICINMTGDYERSQEHVFVLRSFPVAHAQ